MLKVEIINNKYNILDENNNIVFSAYLEGNQIILKRIINSKHFLH